MSISHVFFRGDGPALSTLPVMITMGNCPDPGVGFNKAQMYAGERARQLDLSADWTSFLDKVDLVLFEGTCFGGPASACPGLRLVASPRVTDAKPLPVSASNLSPGPYTLRIDNLGPGPETIRYQVRLTPK